MYWLFNEITTKSVGSGLVGVRLHWNIPNDWMNYVLTFVWDHDKKCGFCLGRSETTLKYNKWLNELCTDFRMRSRQKVWVLSWSEWDYIEIYQMTEWIMYWLLNEITTKSVGSVLVGVRLHWNITNDWMNYVLTFELFHDKKCGSYLGVRLH